MVVHGAFVDVGGGYGVGVHVHGHIHLLWVRSGVVVHDAHHGVHGDGVDHGKDGAVHGVDVQVGDVPVANWAWPVVELAYCNIDVGWDPQPDDVPFAMDGVEDNNDGSAVHDGGVEEAHDHDHDDDAMAAGNNVHVVEVAVQGLNAHDVTVGEVHDPVVVVDWVDADPVVLVVGEVQTSWSVEHRGEAVHGWVVGHTSDHHHWEHHPMVQVHRWIRICHDHFRYFWAVLPVPVDHPLRILD